MPNWKKLITSGSDAVLNNITASGEILIPSYIEHTGDDDTKIGFSAGNTVVLVTGGSIRLKANNAGAQVTGSLQVTGNITGSDNLYFTTAGESTVSFDNTLNFYDRTYADNYAYIANGTFQLKDDRRLRLGNTTGASGDFDMYFSPGSPGTYLENTSGSLNIRNTSSGLGITVANSNGGNLMLSNDYLSGDTTVRSYRDVFLEGGDGSNDIVKYISLKENDVQVHIHKNTVQTGSIDVSANITVAGKVGAATNDEYFDFGTDAMIKVAIDNVEDFRFADGGTFHANADVVAYSSTVSSDERLKTNIVDTKYGLDHILKLESKEFDWKEKLNGRHDIGFIAQQVQEVVPELVKEVDGLNGEDPHLTVDYAKVVPILVNAIKELKEEIDKLKNN